jgi:hypothetical protein
MSEVNSEENNCTDDVQVRMATKEAIKQASVNSLFEIYEQEFRKSFGFYNQMFLELEQFEHDAIQELTSLYEEIIVHHKCQATIYLNCNNIVLELAKDLAADFDE